MVYHQFYQVIIVQIGVISKILKNILHRYVTIIVPIQIKKRLPDMMILITKFLLKFCLKFQQPIFNHFPLFPLPQFLCVSDLFGLKILLVVCWVLDQVEVGEECFLECV